MKWPKFASSRPSGRGRYAPRDPFATRAVRLLRRVSLVILILTCTIGLSVAGQRLYWFANTSEFFRVTPASITISGASKTLETGARERLQHYLDYNTDNLCRLDVPKLTQQLAELPRALHVHLSKSYPDTLAVQFEERQPLVVARLDKFYLVDETGMLLDTVEARELKALGLPLLTGVPGKNFQIGMSLTDARVHEVLAAAHFIGKGDPALRERIVEWNANGKEEITAFLRSGPEVLFGDQAPLQLLDKLSAALTARPDLAHAKYIDLRMDKQIVFK